MCQPPNSGGGHYEVARPDRSQRKQVAYGLTPTARVTERIVAFGVPGKVPGDSAVQVKELVIPYATYEYRRIARHAPRDDVAYVTHDTFVIVCGKALNLR